jgi:hypothetical protein
VSVFDGRWRSAQAGMSLTQALAQARR